jgi:hypothetical protein
MNTSNSIGLSAANFSISATLNSRGTTTRLHPSFAATCAASADVIVICVDAWISKSKSGHTARANSATAGSCTMIASTPAAATPRKIRSTVGNSGSNTSVLSVMYARAPARCTRCTTSGRFASEKFCARARALKPSSSPK